MISEKGSTLFFQDDPVTYTTDTQGFFTADLLEGANRFKLRVDAPFHEPCESIRRVDDRANVQLHTQYKLNLLIKTEVFLFAKIHVILTDPDTGEEVFREVSDLSGGGTTDKLFLTVAAPKGTWDLRVEVHTPAVYSATIKSIRVPSELMEVDLERTI